MENPTETPEVVRHGEQERSWKTMSPRFHRAQMRAPSDTNSSNNIPTEEFTYAGRRLEKEWGSFDAADALRARGFQQENGRTLQGQTNQEHHHLPPQVLAKAMEQGTSRGLLRWTAPWVEELDAVLWGEEQYTDKKQELVQHKQETEKKTCSSTKHMPFLYLGNEVEVDPEFNMQVENSLIQY